MTGDLCPECGYATEGGCRFDCPLHHPPTDGRRYRHWANEQKEAYVDLAWSVAGRLAEEQRERRWQERHPDVPYDQRYEYWKHALAMREGGQDDARQSA